MSTHISPVAVIRRFAAHDTLAVSCFGVIHRSSTPKTDTEAKPDCCALHRQLCKSHSRTRTISGSSARRRRCAASREFSGTDR